jgi:hypothetical protein
VIKNLTDAQRAIVVEILRHQADHGTSATGAAHAIDPDAKRFGIREVVLAIEAHAANGYGAIAGDYHRTAGDAASMVEEGRWS